MACAKFTLKFLWSPPAAGQWYRLAEPLENIADHFPADILFTGLLIRQDSFGGGYDGHT
jgi:hypothetical protein